MLEEITKQISEKATSAGALGNTVKFVFNDGQGVIYLDGNNGNAISNEDKDADCTVNVALEDFQSMMTGDLNPTSAFMGGKMQIDGDMSVAMKLQSIF